MAIVYGRPARRRSHDTGGQGLGVRILGPVKKEFADLLRRADDVSSRSCARRVCTIP
jgi:GMP synthase PP-ATPase subunit